MQFDPILFRIIDTPQFQRLRELHQLGTAYLVFPGATHTRFEHSLGVAHLAGQLIRHIQTTQPELNVTDHEVLLVQIAGLCHDLGHGPFSHIFDNVFLPRVFAEQGKTCTWTHESGSLMMLDSIYNDNIHNIQDYISKKDLQLIKSLIIHSTDHNDNDNDNDNDNNNEPLTNHKFLYDIVSNARNGVDVDKFDYLLRDSYYTKLGFSNNFEANRLIQSTRVIDDEICFNKKDAFNVYEMFGTRYKLHKLCYSHRVCKAIELMIVDILLLAEPYLHISDKIHSPQQYLLLTDNILHEIERSNITELKPAQDILYRLTCRDLYKMVKETVLPHHDNIIKQMKKLTEDDILQFDNTGLLSKHDMHVHNLKLNYALKDKNPVDYVMFYHKSAVNKKFKVGRENVSLLVPSVFEEVIIRVFVKRPNQHKIRAARRALYKLLRPKRNNSNTKHNHKQQQQLSQNSNHTTTSIDYDNDHDHDMNNDNDATQEIQHDNNGQNAPPQSSNVNDNDATVPLSNFDVKPPRHSNSSRNKNSNNTNSTRKTSRHRSVSSPERSNNRSNKKAKSDDEYSIYRNASSGVATFTSSTIPDHLRTNNHAASLDSITESFYKSPMRQKRNNNSYNHNNGTESQP